MTDSNAAAWGTDSEVSTLREVLLCAPDHLAFMPDANAVTRSIAANKQQTFDRELAGRQHRAFTTALESQGVTVRWLPLIPSQQAQAYTRDSSFMTPWGLVLLLMQAERRRGEYAAVVEFCRSRNIPIWRMVTNGPVEGGDVHVAKPGKLLVGYSNTRTNEAGARQVAGWFSAQGWDAKVIYFDAHFLHLDLLFCMVSEDTAVICTEVLPPSMVDGIVNFLGINHVVHGTYRQAMKLLCNVFSLGNRRVLIHKDDDNTDLKKQLGGLGFTSIELDLSMFVLDGGGPHCLTMALRRDLRPGA